MQEVTDLERRITAALERISRSVALGIDAKPDMDASGAAADAGGLSEALDEERMANAQLHERLRSLGQKEQALRQSHESEMAALKATHAGQTQDLRAEVDRLERALSALQAERRAEAEQITDIVAALNPLIEEARHA